MRRILLTTTTLALMAGTAAAADAPKSDYSTDISKAPAGVYALEKNHASITFKVMHMGFAAYTMRFNDFDAKLNLDPKKPEASAVNVTINPASLDSNNPKLTEHVSTPDFLDVAKYPTITFASTGIEKTGPNTGKITGNLTLLGVTKPIVLDATFNGGGTHPMMKKHDIGFSATTAFKRSDFGVSGYIPMVGDEVTATIEAEFLKQ
jgi:polyisoprenoid-binding protein YceI